MVGAMIGLSQEEFDALNRGSKEPFVNLQRRDLDVN
jgi:hypothetical protein